MHRWNVGDKKRRKTTLMQMFLKVIIKNEKKKTKTRAQDLVTVGFGP